MKSDRTGRKTGFHFFVKSILFMMDFALYHPNQMPVTWVGIVSVLKKIKPVFGFSSWMYSGFAFQPVFDQSDAENTALWHPVHTTPLFSR